MIYDEDEGGYIDGTSPTTEYVVGEWEYDTAIDILMNPDSYGLTRDQANAIVQNPAFWRDWHAFLEHYIP